MMSLLTDSIYLGCIAVILLFITNLNGSLAQVELYVDDACKTKDNQIGVCTVLIECESIVNNLRTRKINFDSLVHCAFIGASSVVCCPDRKPVITNSTRKPLTDNDNRIIFEGDLSDTTTRHRNETTTTIGERVIVPPTPPVDTQLRSAVGTKSDAACAQWRINASPPMDIKIIGGVAADTGEFPHMAGLGFAATEPGQDYSFECGGSLISRNYVLTAAHCVNRRQPIIIRLGKTTINTDEDFNDPVDVGIENITIHEGYTPPLQYHDIALIKLNTSVQIDDKVRPSCLYTNTSDIGTGVELHATGWGKTNELDRSDILLKINLTAVPSETCNETYIDLGPNSLRRTPNGIIDGQLCAHDDKLEKDTCQGDSGGPLQIKYEDTQVSTIVGVVSFGFSCASIIPGVYTRVGFYLAWIESIVWPT